MVAAGNASGSSDGPPSKDLMEALRPQSVRELHEAVKDGARRRGPLPPIVSQLAEFCERRTECEERCIKRLRDRAVSETTLLPKARNAEGSVIDANSERRQQVTSTVAVRFKLLEDQCTVLCGKKLIHLINCPAN
eukprot:TRINITY_DN37218_c0_g1_i1.p1 TRINITY_DN37218_c0_g1~~TRINITY_DN37218_c0_g1_i1.p1  ORF type:complete len:155 (-),score=34.18 TRINITY_DN37218_c0_g1_i1:170-574(-)